MEVGSKAPLLLHPGFLRTRQTFAFLCTPRIESTSTQPLCPSRSAMSSGFCPLASSATKCDISFSINLAALARTLKHCAGTNITRKQTKSVAHVTTFDYFKCICSAEQAFPTHLKEASLICISNMQQSCVGSASISVGGLEIRCRVLRFKLEELSLFWVICTIRGLKL